MLRKEIGCGPVVSRLHMIVILGGFGTLWKEMLFRLGFGEILRNVAMAFENVYYFEAVFLVAEEDHIALEGATAQAQSKLRARYAISNGNDARWSQ
jgi:hypothetical protein